MEEKKLFDKLDKIIKLLGLVAMQGKSLKDQVQALSDFGLTPGEIAEITGKNPNLIRVTKFSLKKKEKSINSNLGEAVKNE